MSTVGPLSDITEAEKQKFRPLYVQLMTLQISEKDVLAILGGDEKMAKKFQNYTAMMIQLLKPKQPNDVIKEPVERREMLVKQKIQRDAAMVAPRAESPERLQPTTEVNSTSRPMGLKC